MSGHSKWATTKHKKAVIDAKRGKLFAKLIKNIEVAARMGGGDLAGNPTLYDAIQKAKKTSVPNDNIDRAVKRGVRRRGRRRRLPDDHVRGLRPERRRACSSSASPTTRTAPPSEVRTAMTRNGGSMADPGSVSYLFNRKGVVIVPKADGADRGRRARGRRWTPAPRRSTTSASPSRWSARPPTWSRCAPRCRTAGIDYDSADAVVRAQRCRSSSTRTAPRKVFRLIDALEDLDDVQNVFANFDVPDEVMEELDA